MPDAERSEPGSDVAQVLTEAVRAAGALALRKFRTSFRSWTKDKTSIVTEVDIEIDELLHDRLSAHDTTYGWLSEESADDPVRLFSRRVWIVDPIDGTRGFIAGQEDWTVVAALIEEGRPIAAAVYAPVDDHLFVAEAGKGTTLNGAPVRVRDGHTLAGARANGARRRLEALCAIEPSLEIIPRLNSLALRLARVAEGRFDLVLSGGNSRDWDIAAADLLVQEAGGVLSDMEGRPLVYNRPEPVHGPLLAAGRSRHAAVLKLVRDHDIKFA